VMAKYSATGIDNTKYYQFLHKNVDVTQRYYDTIQR